MNIYVNIHEQFWGTYVWANDSLSWKNPSFCLPWNIIYIWRFSSFSLAPVLSATLWTFPSPVRPWLSPCRASRAARARDSIGRRTWCWGRRTRCRRRRRRSSCMSGKDDEATRSPPCSPSFRPPLRGRRTVAVKDEERIQDGNFN